LDDIDTSLEEINQKIEGQIKEKKKEELFQSDPDVHSRCHSDMASYFSR